jgi:hypothetical protein
MTDESHLTLEDKLRADLGPDSEALSPILRRIDSFSAPEPSSAETARLLAALRPALTGARAAGFTPYVAGLANAWPVLLLRAQVPIIHQELWLASALVLAIGTFVTLAIQTAQQSPETLLLVFLAPIVTAFGVAFLYGPGVDAALELELATPVSPRTLLLARLVLIFGFNLALSLLASLLVSFFMPPISIVALVLAWLAPMAFLSALAFLLSVVCFDHLAGVTGSILLWAVQVFKAIGGFDGWPLMAGLPDLFASGSQPWLFALAAALVLAAVWAAGRDERWSRPNP